MLRIVGLAVALLLAGCGQSYVYIRADGHDIGSDPALYKQFEIDSMTCQGEVHRQGAPTGRGVSVGAGGGAVNDCMAAKGYTVVQSELADLKRQDLAAKAGSAPDGAVSGVTGGAAALRPAPALRAAESSSGFDQCTRISDKAARLACFDRAAVKGSDSRR
jgi:hypothetical protein